MAFSCFLRILVASTIFVSYYASGTYSDWRTIMTIDCIWTCTYVAIYFSDLLLLFTKRRAKAKDGDELAGDESLMELMDQQHEEAAMALKINMETATAWATS